MAYLCTSATRPVISGVTFDSSSGKLNLRVRVTNADYPEYKNIGGGSTIIHNILSGRAGIARNDPDSGQYALKWVTLSGDHLSKTNAAPPNATGWAKETPAEGDHFTASTTINIPADVTSWRLLLVFTDILDSPRWDAGPPTALNIFGDLPAIIGSWAAYKDPSTGKWIIGAIPGDQAIVRTLNGAPTQVQKKQWADQVTAKVQDATGCLLTPRPVKNPSVVGPGSSRDSGFDIYLP